MVTPTGPAPLVWPWTHYTKQILGLNTQLRPSALGQPVGNLSFLSLWGAALAWGLLEETDRLMRRWDDHSHHL